MPHSKFEIWFIKYGETITNKLYKNPNYNKEISLLNTTIRYV